MVLRTGWIGGASALAYKAQTPYRRPVTEAGTPKRIRIGQGRDHPALFGSWNHLDHALKTNLMKDQRTQPLGP